VVKEGMWDDPEMVGSFENTMRAVAEAAGGLPIEVQLMDRMLDVRRGGWRKRQGPGTEGLRD